MAAASGEPRKLDERQVVEKFKALRSHETSLISKIAELQAELREHEMVLGVLGPLPDSRRCYRMAGEMLLEQTVVDVKPAVAEHKEGIEKLIAQLEQALTSKTKERQEFQTKHNIVVRQPGAPQ
ncbi:PFDN2 [Symbiodinium sp. KB8]|nr:PFDN2 [Symbiodinium sp. KB8]